MGGFPERPGLLAVMDLSTEQLVDADLSQGGILFTPPGDNQVSQNLCMSCFESMATMEIKPEKAA